MPRAILKKSLSRNFILPFRRPRRFIFFYHDISDPDSVQHSWHYSTSIQKFKEQIEFLSGKFEWVDLDSIRRQAPFKTHVASLVFDDAFKSVQSNAMPLLQAKGIPFSVFASRHAVLYNRLWVSDLEFNKTQLEKDLPGFSKEIQSVESFQLLQKNSAFHKALHGIALTPYNKEQIYLNAEDVKLLHSKGVIIGSHAATHANLHFCDETSLKAEITGNKLFLEEILQSSVKHFAIPFGKKEHYTSSALVTAREAGHEFIYSSNPSSFSISAKTRLIPRIGLTENSTMEIMFYINRQFLKNLDL
jgi:peptidoglycan/xylan/chitin deacetylase (PgdA/CDA1 family)